MTSDARPREGGGIAEPTCILVVASQSVATPALLDVVRARAAAGPARFILLIPEARSATVARWTLKHALPMFRRAAGDDVEGIVAPGEDPVTAAAGVLAREHVDEIVISTLSPRRSRWLRREVPVEMERLGVPVTVVSGVAAAAQPRTPA
jgi:hypothetical protein